MTMIFRVSPPYQWVQYEGGRVEEFGEVAALTDLPESKTGESIGVLDAASSSFHHVDMPAKNIKQLTAAVPFALEETLTDDIEDLHFTVSDWKPGETAVVAVVAKDVVQGVIDDVKAANVGMDKLIPELSFVPIHEAADETVVVSPLNGELRYLLNSRSNPPVVLDEDLLGIYVDGLSVDSKGIGTNDESTVKNILNQTPALDVRHWAIGDNIKSWLEYGDLPKLDLLHNEYQGLASKQKGSNGLKWAAALLFTAFLLKCLFDGYEYMSLWKENRWLDHQMTNVLQESFPKVNNIIKGKERFIMEQQFNAANGAGASNDFNEMLAVIAAASKRSKFVIGDIRFRANSMNLTCTVKDFSQVDQLTKELNSYGVDARLTSSAAEGSEVSARYTLQRKL